MSNAFGNVLLQQEILLESGTNEVEILVFQVGAYRVGINVAKVREILVAPKITELPKAHPSVLGCFRLRDVVVPCVSLHRHLKQEPAEGHCQTAILTEFNHSQTAFLVDQVERIHKVSWQQVQPLPSLVLRRQSPVTAVTQLDGRLVIMLDFETISAQIAREKAGGEAVPNPRGVSRQQVRVLVADDSATIRHAVEAILRRSGYESITTFNHGGEAWDWISDRVAQGQTARDFADILISDVEMPVMDGFHLTKRVKEHPQLQELPVVLYSSILTPDNEKKGAYVKADAQITKPELGKVVELADRFALGGVLPQAMDRVDPDPTGPPAPAPAARDHRERTRTPQPV